MGSESRPRDSSRNNGRAEKHTKPALETEFYLAKMRLDLRFSDHPLETVLCQAVTVFAFDRPDLEQSGLANVDKKMGGILSNLISKGQWTGKSGEVFLLSSEGTIPAEKILIHGLGPSSGYNIGVLKCGLQSMGSSLDKIAVNDFAVCFPPLEDQEKEYTTDMENILPVLVKAFFEGHQGEKDYFLKIMCCVKKNLMHLLIPVADRLIETFSSFLECSIIIGNEEEWQYRKSSRNWSPPKRRDKRYFLFHREGSKQ